MRRGSDVEKTGGQNLLLFHNPITLDTLNQWGYSSSENKACSCDYVLGIPSSANSSWHNWRDSCFQLSACSPGCCQASGRGGSWAVLLPRDTAGRGSRTSSHKAQSLLSCEQQLMKAPIHSPSWILTSAAEKVTILLALVTPAKIVIRGCELIAEG